MSVGLDKLEDESLTIPSVLSNSSFTADLKDRTSEDGEDEEALALVLAESVPSVELH